MDKDNRKRKKRSLIAALSIASCLSVILFAVLFNREGTSGLETMPQPTEKINQALISVKDQVLLTESEDKRIAIWGDPESETDMIEGITVRIDNKSHKFAWRNTTNPSFYPEVWLASVAGDDNQKVIINLTQGTGTGVHESEVHVLNFDFSEIRVTDPKKELEQFIQTKASKKAEKQQYSITVSGKEHLFEYNETDAGLWFDDVFFGNVINYNVQDDTLIAEVSAQVSPGTFPGTAKLRYSLKEGALQVSQIEWMDAIDYTPAPKAKTYDEINSVLTQDKNVLNLAWSPDQTRVVYSKGLDDQGKVYMWIVGEDAAKLVVLNKFAENTVSGIIWTPDSSHFLVDSGTAADRGGYLFSLKSAEPKVVKYYSGVYFSPDSKWMLYSEGIDIQSSYKKDLEAGYSYNLAVLNIDTNEIMLLFEATDTTDFYAKGWSTDSKTIQYSKKDYSKQTEEKLELRFEGKVAGKVRAVGKTVFGDIQIVSENQDTTETLGAPSCMGLAEDYSFKGNYQAIFKDTSGKARVISQNGITNIISPSKETLSLDKLSFKGFESLAFTPQYTDCHEIIFYMYGLTKQGAFQFKFITDQNTTDSFSIAPNTKAEVIDDQLVLDGGRAAADVGYATRYYFKPNVAAQTMILTKTEKINQSILDFLKEATQLGGIHQLAESNTITQLYNYYAPYFTKNYVDKIILKNLKQEGDQWTIAYPDSEKAEASYYGISFDAKTKVDEQSSKTTVTSFVGDGLNAAHKETISLILTKAGWRIDNLVWE